jgi:hypothetical protein
MYRQGVSSHATEIGGYALIVTVFSCDNFGSLLIAGSVRCRRPDGVRPDFPTPRARRSGIRIHGLLIAQKRRPPRLFDAGYAQGRPVSYPMIKAVNAENPADFFCKGFFYSFSRSTSSAYVRKAALG